MIAAVEGELFGWAADVIIGSWRRQRPEDAAGRRREQQGTYFFRRRMLAKPAKPVPKRSIVAGSGTGATVEKSSRP